MEPNAEHRCLLPGEQDIARYREHGYWISPVILPGELVDAAERGMARLYAGDIDHHHDHDTVGIPGLSAPAGLRKDDYASLRVDELARLVATPLIGRIAALLSGAGSIRLWHDQLLYKPVNSTDRADRADSADSTGRTGRTAGPGAPANVGWHTDRQYWQTCTSDDMLTAWIGFHDVTEDDGAVCFLAGSHRWDVSGLDFFSQDLGALQDMLTAQGHRLDIRPARMRRGQVSFHHCRTVHGSGPNRGDAPRRSLAVHLQPGDNRWRAHTGEDGRAAWHLNDDLVRRTPEGVPDYADPRICPQLWPRAGS